MKAGECSVMHGRKRDIFATFKDSCHKDTADKKPDPSNLRCLVMMLGSAVNCRSLHT
jgi:hypothetical protein